MQLARLKWIIKSLKNLNLSQYLIKQSNIINCEKEKQLVDQMGPWIDYIGTVNVLNSSKCLECHTLRVGSLMHLKK